MRAPRQYRGVCSYCGEPLSIGEITAAPGQGGSDADFDNTPWRLHRQDSE